MPNRLQWWRDQLSDYAIAILLVVLVLGLTAALLTNWLHDIAFYLGTGIIHLPPF
jgi:hypothetical protein